MQVCCLWNLIDIEAFVLCSHISIRFFVAIHRAKPVTEMQRQRNRGAWRSKFQFTISYFETIYIYHQYSFVYFCFSCITFLLCDVYPFFLQIHHISLLFSKRNRPKSNKMWCIRFFRCITSRLLFKSGT